MSRSLNGSCVCCDRTLNGIGAAPPEPGPIGPTGPPGPPGPSGTQIVGMIQMYCSNIVPNPDWHYCDGTALLMASYPELNAILLASFPIYPYGHDPVALTFNLPNMHDAPGTVGTSRGRLPRQFIPPPGAITPEGLGVKSGDNLHTILNTELPLHNHGLMEALADADIGTTNFTHYDTFINEFVSGATVPTFPLFSASAAVVTGPPYNGYAHTNIHHEPRTQTQVPDLPYGQPVNIQNPYINLNFIIKIK